MKVTRYTGGPLPTNCYMLTDESTGASAVIDPGFVNASLLKAVEEADVQAILLTHGHWDHIAGVAEIQKKTGAKLYIDAEDELFLTDSALNLSVELTGRPLPAAKGRRHGLRRRRHPAGKPAHSCPAHAGSHHRQLLLCGGGRYFQWGYPL